MATHGFFHAPLPPSVTPFTAAVAPMQTTTTATTTTTPSEGTEVLSSFLWFHQDRYWNEAAHLLPQVLRLPAKPTTVTVPSKVVTTAKTITKKRTKQSNKRAAITPTTIRRARALASSSRRSTQPGSFSIPSSPISASSPASSPLLPSSPAHPTLSPSSPTSSLSYSASSQPSCGSVPLARHPAMSIAALLN